MSLRDTVALLSALALGLAALAVVAAVVVPLVLGAVDHRR